MSTLTGGERHTQRAFDYKHLQAPPRPLDT